MSFQQGLKNRIANRILKMRFVENHVHRRITQAYPTSRRMGDFNENDVFIVGYPKSGNTWMQNLIAALIYGAHGQSVSGWMVQELVPDVHYKSYYQRFSDVVCFKSHHLPQKEYRRVIYIVRDGRDVLVSFWHYHKALTGEELDYEHMVDSPIYNFGTWSEHLSAWIDNPFNAEQLIVRYEDLIIEGRSTLSNIARFLSVETSPDEIEAVLKANDLSLLKKKEEKFGFGHGAWKTGKSFFRRGIIGSYKEEMPLRAIESFNNANYKYLQKFSYLT